MDLQSYWRAVLDQDADAMRSFFHSGAVIRWPNTNEQFCTEEFLRANCEYPGSWDGEVERVETSNDLFITVTCVYSKENDLSFHVTSFIRVEGEKIISIDEYWSDDGPAPQWRRDMRLGCPIK